VKKAKAILKIYPATQVFFFLPEKDNHWKMLRY
jgi:hypothetical protein